MNLILNWRYMLNVKKIYIKETFMAKLLEKHIIYYIIWNDLWKSYEIANHLG